jgi:hypothetical protein
MTTFSNLSLSTLQRSADLVTDELLGLGAVPVTALKGNRIKWLDVRSNTGTVEFSVLEHFDLKQLHMSC